MADKELQRKKEELSLDLTETGVRIRRYTLDPRLREDAKTKVDDELRRRADAAWEQWLKVWDRFQALEESPGEAELRAVRRALMEVEREVDLIQRELISAGNYSAGVKTVAGLAVALVGLALLYLFTHGVTGLDFSAFEPLPEWGPLKYVEVAFWSSFGVLCWMLYLATYYLKRRDFDPWYCPWYVSTGLRAPFLTVILMVVVLEFVEWYGEGTWIETYLLEEGNKFYFIAFTSFCLGLMSEETSSIIRELATGVVDFVRRAVARVVGRMGSVFSQAGAPRR